MNKSPRRVLARWISAALAVGLLAGTAGLLCNCDRKKKPDVILVIIDTLPASHSSAYGYERSTTPTIEKVAKDGVLFQKAMSTSPWTLPSIASILTGGFPSRHRAGVNLEDYQKEDRLLSRMRQGMTTLADLFKDHGYQTVAFFNCPFTHPEFGLNQGFDTYSYYEGGSLDIRPADQLVREAMTWIEEKGGDPFFMVIHVFDPHLAYNPPMAAAAPYISNYRGKLRSPFNPELKDVRSGKLQLDDEDKKFVVGLYDGEVAAADVELMRFIRYLQLKGIYDNSMFIITSDHGEEFWEHGSFEHGHTMYREVLEVPLVMKYPANLAAGTKIDGYVSLLDIFPTVAEFMGWKITFQVDGRSLYPRKGGITLPDREVVAENIHYGPEQQCMVAENFKLIIHRATGRIEAFDLSADLGETKDVFGTAALPAKLKFQVEKISQDLGKLLQESAPQAALLDPKTIERLKSLGYLSPSTPPPPPPPPPAPKEPEVKDGATADAKPDTGGAKEAKPVPGATAEAKPAPGATAGGGR